ncbi:MAG: DUF4910 domain-containing protein [Pirellulaceae bacterium]|nr:DUF4910 domain-containing protein [Pirellulaceae bacterium]
MTVDSTGNLMLEVADSRVAGQSMQQFAAELFPFHRAITGAGVRSTLTAIAQRIPLEVRRLPTGLPVLDWEVPSEWELRDAYVQHPAGHKVIQLAKSNLHVVSYSVGVDEQLSWPELKPFLYTLPEHPDWIPYRTAHFQTRWGFCLSHRDWESLESDPPAGTFRALIDAQQKPGHLEWGEVFLAGQRSEEFLISTHICHPSLANDNLSGIVIATELARRLAALPQLPFSFRFLFIPATIGAIAWLDQNRENVSRICGGLVLSNLGDSGAFTYKSSRQRTALIDQTVNLVLKRLTVGARLRDFVPWGYDERQFCSPGFDLPIGRFTRSPEGAYPQYHTSADDLNLIQPGYLSQSLQVLCWIISEFAKSFPRKSENIHAAQSVAESSSSSAGKSISGSDVYVNLHPFGEPKLDRYGLYKGYGQVQNMAFQQAVLWALNLSDGKHTFDDIVVRSGLDAQLLRRAIEKLSDCNLLTKIN